MARPKLTELLLRHDQRVMAAALGLIVVGCAGFILAGGGTGMSALGMVVQTGPAGSLLNRIPEVVTPMLWSPGYALVIFVMWWLMMVAMMVPTAAPTILLYGAMSDASYRWASLLFALGYLTIWAVFSAVATAAQGVLAALGQISPMYMTVVAPWLGAVMLIGAGLYQFTPLKAACLEHCRGPVEALVRHRRTGRAAAFRMGLVHGSFCLGCCWALMALLFVGGIMNLWWILAIAVYVGFEKLAPGGEKLAQALGVVLILVGVALLVPVSGLI